MKKSYISILLLFLVMILAISAASAAEIDETSDSDALAADEATVDEVVSTDSVDDVQTATEEAEVLTDAGDGNNFTSLQTLIDKKGETVLLDKDYVRVEGDSSLNINEDITIVGGYHKIDAANLGGIFNVKSGVTLVLTGVTLVNGNSDYGGAIYNEGTVKIISSELTDNSAKIGGAIYNKGIASISGSTLNGNQATTKGGAVYSEGTLVVSDSSFENNNISTGDSYTDSLVDCNGGGAIYASNDIRVTGSTFTKNTAPHASEVFSAGGAIYIKEKTALIDDCTFNENSAVYGGAIIFEDFSQDTVAIKDSRFNNNQAWQGGAINGNDLVGSLIITGSNFTTNKATTPNAGQSSPTGGAIMVGSKSYAGIALDVAGCNFVENDGGYMGGAIASSPDNTIKVADSNFTGNVATTLGGAIVTGTGTDLTVSGSTFNDNKVSSGTGMGGAIFCEPTSKNNITGSNFTNNVDGYSSAIMSYQGTLDLSENTFTGTSIFNYAGTITSEINAIVLNNDTVETDDGNVALSARVTDDNDNVIRDSTLQFDINGVKVAAVYDVADGYYKATYALPTPGFFTVGIISSKNDDMTVKNGTVKNFKGTFKDLQMKIDAAIAAGQELDLTYDFAYDATIDGASFINGVIINEEITINGNDHSIDGSKTARIFYIGTFADATINGIVFKNGTADKGGALFVAGKLDIDNCTFIDNVATTSGSDIYIMTSSVVVVNGEESYNYLLNDPDSSLNKYYNDNPREDGIDANGNPVHDSTTPIVGHSWESAITTWMDNVIIDGVTYKWEDGYSKFPWILINTNDFTGYIEFWYDGELKFNWTGNTNRERGVVSVLADLGMPDYSLTYQYGTVRDKVFDPSLLTVKYVGTTGGRPVTMISTTSDSVTIKNSVFNGDGNSIYNLGKLALENNTVKGIIYNNGTITSQVNSTILNNETIETADYSYKLNATLTDDNGNKINDPKLKFKVNNVEVAAIYDEANGVYTYDAYPIDFEPKYVVDVTTTNENKLSTKKGVIINLKYGTFTDLQAKIADAIANHKVLNLTYDFTYTAGVDDTLKEGIDIGSDLTINGNGTIISGNNTARIFNVINGATLTLTNATLTKGNATNGSAINSNGKLELTEVTFSENVAVDCGGAIYNNKGTVNIEDCVFDKNDLTNRKDGYEKDYGGAAIYSVGGTLNINGSKFTNNLLNYYPGENGENRDLITAAITSSGVTVINNTAFENNSGCYGADLMVFKSSKITDPASLTIDNSNFTNTRSYAGGIQISKIDFNITNSNFNNCIAYSVGTTGYTASGGALFAVNCNNGIIKNTNFTNCGNTQGGAIDIEKTKSLLIDGCTFENNSVSTQGGALSIVQPAGDVTITNTDFINNSAKNAGAVYYWTVSDNKLTISDCEFENNSATDSGAAVYALMYPAGSVDVSNSNFTNNNATKRGAAIFFYTSGSGNELTISNSNFTDNSAATGEAIYTYPKTVTKITDSNFTNNGEATDYTIYNSGTLELTRTTVDNLVYSSGTFNTELNATFLNNKTWNDTGLGDMYILNATLTDKNGNKIYDPNFRFAVDGENITGILYNKTTGLYTVGYYMKTAGLKVISTNYIADNLKLSPGALYIELANVTEFTVSPGGQGNRIPYGENVTVYVGLYGVNDEGLNETFTVIVNNTEYTVTVVNGTGSFNVSGLEPDDYSAQAIFDSNPNYNKAYASGVFSVLRPDRTLSIAVENVELGETAIVNITINKGDESDIGIVVLNINGTEYTVSVEGSVSFEIAGLPIGTHVVNATLLADGLDDAVVNDTENITVTDDHEVTVAVTANETISYGENLTVEIGQIISSGLEKVVTGNATIYIYDGDDSTVEPVIAFPCNVGEDGVAVDFKGLSVGNYMIIVDFDSADGYYAGQATTYATVKQAKSSIVIKPIGEVTYGNDVTIEYTVLNATTIRINVATKDLKPVYYDTFDANVSEYSNSFVLPNLAAGEYIVVVENDGNDNYTFSSTSREFTVNKAETTMQTEITPDIKVGDEGVVIKVVLPENATGKVMLSIDDKPVSQMGYELINGTANITVPADFVTAGKHSYYVSYDGDDNYTSAYDFKSFEVSKVTPAVNIVLNESEIGVAGSALVNITVAGDATGKLLIDNNGTLSIVELTNGNYTLELYDLVAGEYYINVTYIGDDKYSGANASKVITVPKADVKIVYETVTPEIKYGESATVKVDINPDFATGNVTIFVDNIEYETVDLDEDYANATIIISGLAMGSHNITVTYNGDENYNKQTGFSQNAITVTKGQPTIEIMLDNDVIEVGSEISVIYGIWGEVNGGNITISIDGVECYNKPINGTVNYIDILSDLLTAGNHTISAQYLGDDLNLPSNIDKVNVTVLNMSEIKINIDTPENTTDLVFSVTLPSNATGYLFVDVDGQHYYAPVKNGTASVTVPSLAPGNYTAAITYSGDDQYDSVTLTKEVSVASNVPDNAFTIPDTAKDGEPLTYSINLPSDAKGYLEVDVDGKKYVAPLENGSASISVPGLSAGSHNVTVSYTGDGKYSPVTKSVAMNVPAPVYKITNNNNVAAIYSANANYKVLITKDGKAVGAGESVTFNFNGKTYTVKTDSKGYATLNLNTKVKVKTYTVTAEYKGVKVSNKVTIKHVIKAKNVNVKKSKKVNKIKVKTNKVNGKFLKGKKLTLKIKGKKIKAKINKKGVATFKVKKSVLKKLKVGKNYKYTVTYGKDKVTKKVKVKR